MTKPHPRFVRLWFVADAVLALAPPLHWAASGGAPILGAPRILAYLFATSAFIASSVIAAYVLDPAGREG